MRVIGKRLNPDFHDFRIFLIICKYHRRDAMHCVSTMSCRNNPVNPLILKIVVQTFCILYLWQ